MHTSGPQVVAVSEQIVRQDTRCTAPNANDVPHRMGNGVRLADLLDQVRPTILVDTSATADACTEALVRQLVAHTPDPSCSTVKSSRLPDSLAHDLSTGPTAVRSSRRADPDRPFTTIEGTDSQRSQRPYLPWHRLGCHRRQSHKHQQSDDRGRRCRRRGMVETTKSTTLLLPPLTHLRHTSATVAIAVATAAETKALPTCSP